MRKKKLVIKKKKKININKTPIKSKSITPFSSINSSVENLTPKQAMFVIEYLKDMNGAQAAIRAGYSEDTAKEIASENLTKPNIKKAIDEQMYARAQRTLITADWILGQMKEVALRCMQATPVHGKVGVWEFDHAGANKALENLARNQKLLTDKSEIGNLDGTNLIPPTIIFEGSKNAGSSI